MRMIADGYGSATERQRRQRQQRPRMRRQRQQASSLNCSSYYDVLLLLFLITTIRSSSALASNGASFGSFGGRCDPRMDSSSMAHHRNCDFTSTTRTSTALLFSASSSSSSSSGGDLDAPSSTMSSRPPDNKDYDYSEESDTKNSRYIFGLLENLSLHVDKWILSGNAHIKEKAYNVLEQIRVEAQDPTLVTRAVRLMRRAGLPVREQETDNDNNNGPAAAASAFQPKQLHSNTVVKNQNQNQNTNPIELGRTDDAARRKDAEQRRLWEASRISSSSSSSNAEKAKATTTTTTAKTSDSRARSALGRRLLQEEGAGGGNNNKPDLLLRQVLDPSSLATFRDEKSALQQAMRKEEEIASSSSMDGKSSPFDDDNNKDDAAVDVAAVAKVSGLIAKAGAGTAFDGASLGIGGLDDVLKQVKRRIWTPLAAPPQLLLELGIHPVRGLLLYGKPGCGKTLLASKLGQLLSPLRPITVVSGPEIMDKFVGSSEKNLREIFDNPPDIYDFFRINCKDKGAAMARAALHVIIMDEFDAIARSRGGRDGKGDQQGDAGVARDSVVNQLLAKMDGVDPLAVPTLVIGLTNKRSLIEPALLRPGRFEVQVEVPPPRTMSQRISILKVHTRLMHEAGRLLVRDAPDGSAAARRAGWSDELISYEQLLECLAEQCAGFSGASIAGVCRAAASHALERAVEEFTRDDAEDTSLLDDCVVTESDFEDAVKDVIESQGYSDWSEEEEEDDEQSAAEASTTTEDD